MRLVNFLILPGEVTAFERQYLARMNRVALWFFAAHVPFLSLVALLNGTGALSAGVAAAAGLVGPLLALRVIDSPRLRSVVFGVTAMYMGALLVHFGRGLWTIEMHFYFFVALALLAVFANPMVIVVAAATVALHHVVLWAISPSSVFNYEAPLSSVLVHAAFVVVESAAACFVARSFFDNVIGLERIVETRTSELNARTRDMRLVFDHVQQGLLMVDLDGSLNPEHSAILERWLGAPRASDTLASWFGRADGAFSQWLAVGWSQLVEDVMPREVSLALLPRRVRAGDVTLEVQWQAVDANGRLERVLLVVSDITERLSRERADLAQRELLDVFDHLNRDRTGFLEFFAEGRALVETLRGATLPPHLELLRAVHTLKGNCAFFGFSSVAQACHEAEGRAAETEDAQVDVEVAATVCAAWDAASARAIRFLDETRGVIEIEERDYAAIVRAIHEGASSARVLQLIESWKYEPVKKRFQRLGEQACSLARRLNKGELQIASEDHDVRLPRDRFARLFTVLPHVVRNAVDHGLESRGDPACSGKQPWLRFTCVQNVDELVLSVADNGAGIDWAAVAARARALGYDADDPAVLQQALFLDGLSTREEASDVSGRGLGMAAVREACEALGGRVIVDSQPGAGTCISLHVPTKGPHA